MSTAHSAGLKQCLKRFNMACDHEQAQKPACAYEGKIPCLLATVGVGESPVRVEYFVWLA